MYAHLTLILVAFIWGLNPPAMKIGLMYIPVMPYSAIRLFVALAVGCLVFPHLFKWVPLRQQDKKPLFIAGLGLFFFHLFFTFGLQLTTAGNASLILGCLPISVAIISHIHRIEKLTAGVLVGIFLSLLGVVFMVAGTGQKVSLSGSHIEGALLVLAAQISYGYFTIFTRPLSRVYSVYQITLYVLAMASGLFGLVSLSSLVSTSWVSIPWSGWASALYSGILPLCLANCLWIWGAAKAGSTTASLYFNLAPVFTVAVGYFMLGEAFGWLQLFGALIIIVGLYITKKHKEKVAAIRSRKAALCGCTGK